MWLNFWEVSVVEVAWIFQISVSENNDAAAFVTHGQELTSLVKLDRGEDVGIINVCPLTLTESINIDPISRLDRLWVGAVLSRAYLWTGICSRFTHRDYYMLVALIRRARRSSNLYIGFRRTADHLDFFGARAAGAASARRHTRVVEQLHHICLKQGFWVSLLLIAELVNHLTIYHCPIVFYRNLFVSCMTKLLVLK